jgi:hypothetical protein
MPKNCNPLPEAQPTEPVKVFDEKGK